MFGSLYVCMSMYNKKNKTTNRKRCFLYKVVIVTYDIEPKIWSYVQASFLVCLSKKLAKCVGTSKEASKQASKQGIIFFSLVHIVIRSFWCQVWTLTSIFVIFFVNDTKIREARTKESQRWETFNAKWRLSLLCIKIFSASFFLAC